VRRSSDGATKRQSDEGMKETPDLTTEGRKVRALHFFSPKPKPIAISSFPAAKRASTQA
jgi:hypothetical protein